MFSAVGTKRKLIESLKGGLIVSCQVKTDDPLYTDDIVANLAKCAVWGGAKGLRLNEPRNIAEVRPLTELPIIGLWKVHTEGCDVFITPSMEHVEAVINAGADIVAVDATDRPNVRGVKAYEIISEIREKFGDFPILADVRNGEEAQNALLRGADMVAPTLYRFGNAPKSTEDPDFGELSKMLEKCEGIGPVIMEGKIHTPEQAMESLYMGAHAVVVGSAITRPHLTALRFVNRIEKRVGKMPLYY